MATLTTKYDMGDVVWRAWTATEKRQHPCPDCLGAKKWPLVSPAGGEFEVACPRCAGRYQNDRSLSLDYSMFAPRASKLTIGKITASTATGDDYDAGTKYMCLETGVGSGSVYPEDALFPTEAEALAAAQEMADRTNADADHWVAQQYDKSVEFADYEMKDARTEAANHQRIASQVRMEMLLDDLVEMESVDDIRQAVEKYRNGSDD